MKEEQKSYTAELIVLLVFVLWVWQFRPVIMPLISPVVVPVTNLATEGLLYFRETVARPITDLVVYLVYSSGGG